jgi:hypothetical protein
VSSSPKHVAKHRAPSSRRAPRAALRTTFTLSSLAVVATGFAVGGGSISLSAGSSSGTGDLGAVTSSTGDGADRTGSTAAQQVADAAGSDRPTVVSRSDRRRDADPLKQTALSVDGDNALTRSEDFSDEDPRVIALALLAEFGFAEDQFGCLDSLWERESHWNPLAANPSSGAYGIPQSLPGSKMATVAPDWRTNPITQIRWGLGYIEDRYGSPCGAWGHSQSHGWY